MVKLSISLPNSTQITLESDEFDVIDRVLSLLLQESVQGVAPTAVPAPSITNGHGNAGEKGTDAITERPNSSPSFNGTGYGQSPPAMTPRYPPQHQPVEPPVNGSAKQPMSTGNDQDDDGLFLEGFTPAAQDDFVAFCQNLNPMGDMRRVVVAAEGASRFFRADGVNADELAELFDLAGWRRANSFTQTLRNAARSKFGWLERIPGRSGRYAATDLGRSVTMGS